MSESYRNPAILECACWPHVELSADYKAGANVWRKVSAEFADEMLNALPPMYVRGVRGFMLGEAFDHNARGEAVHTGIVQFSGQNYARNIAWPDFAEAVRGLVLALPDTFGAGALAAAGAACIARGGYN